MIDYALTEEYAVVAMTCLEINAQNAYNGWPVWDPVVSKVYNGNNREQDAELLLAASELF